MGIPELENHKSSLGVGNFDRPALRCRSTKEKPGSQGKKEKEEVQTEVLTGFAIKWLHMLGVRSVVGDRDVPQIVPEGV